MKKQIFLFVALLSVALFACKEMPANGNAATTANADSAKMATQPNPNEPDTTIKKFDATASDLLPGKWQDLADKKSTIAFADGKFIEMYDGKMVEEGGLTIDETCASCTPKTDGPTMGCFKSKNKDGKEDCYRILQIDLTTMEYTMLGSTGKSHKMTKMK